MLKLVQIGNGMPTSYPVDITSEFQPGQVAQLKLIGQDIVVGLSDGTAPFGIIDDVRTQAFTQSVTDEVVLIMVPEANIETPDGYNYFTNADIKEPLANAGIMKLSFMADYEGIVLNHINGLVILPAGSKLNFDSGSGKNDSVKTIVNYVYQIASLPGDDTTIGSNRVTIWFQRGIFATDQFDTTQRYPLNAVLFVSEEGKFTTKQPTPDHPGMAVVTGPPSSMISTIELMWL